MRLNVEMMIAGEKAFLIYPVGLRAGFVDRVINILDRRIVEKISGDYRPTFYARSFKRQWATETYIASENIPKVRELFDFRVLAIGLP